MKLRSWQRQHQGQRGSPRRHTTASPAIIRLTDAVHQSDDAAPSHAAGGAGKNRSGGTNR
mgnify:CR=1 FL=1